MWPWPWTEPGGIPAAWREPSARPAELLTARYWVDMARLAEQGLVDFLTIEDSLRPAGGRRTDVVQGRLDAVLIAARVAPVTTRIGLVPSVTVTHTEPFHVSKAIATLDFVSFGSGRGAGSGLRPPRRGRPLRPPDVSVPNRAGRPGEPDRRWPGICSKKRLTTSRCCGVCGTAGRTTPRSATSRPGGSSTGRSCTTSTSRASGSRSEGRRSRPGPPQGQPLVTALAHSSLPYRFAVGQRRCRLRHAARRRRRRSYRPELAGWRQAAGRPAGEVTILADLVVFLGRHDGRGAPAQVATRRHARARPSAATLRSSSAPSTELADLMAGWAGAGVTRVSAPAGGAAG